MKQTVKLIFLEIIMWCLVLVLFIVNNLFLHDEFLAICCLLALTASSIINTIMMYSLTSQNRKKKDGKTGDAATS